MTKKYRDLTIEELKLERMRLCYELQHAKTPKAYYMNKKSLDRINKLIGGYYGKTLKLEAK